jgi:hypothetical protein
MTTDATPDLESRLPCRECWAHCGVEADEEMREIDRQAEELSPLPENITRIRRLVDSQVRPDVGRPGELDAVRRHEIAWISCCG